METFVHDNYHYQFGLVDGQFTIVITEGVTHKEFSLAFDDKSPLFENHSIVKNIEMLQKVLRDAFEKAFDVTMSLFVDEVQYQIQLKINSTYVKDEITLNLPLTSKGVELTPDQMIDKKLSVLTDYVNKQLMDIITVQKYQENAHKNISFAVQTQEPLLMKLNEKLNALVKDHEQLKYTFMEYVDKHPIIIAEKFSKGLFGKPHKRLHYIMSDVRTIKLTYDNRAYYLNDKYRIVNFTYKDFQYFKQLETVTLINCRVHDLDFLNCAGTLKQIALIDMPEVRSINWLTTCSKLTKVIITDDKNITDIHKLSMCRRINYQSEYELLPAVQ